MFVYPFFRWTIIEVKFVFYPWEEKSDEIDTDNAEKVMNIFISLFQLIYFSSWWWRIAPSLKEKSISHCNYFDWIAISSKLLYMTTEHNYIYNIPFSLWGACSLWERLDMCTGVRVWIKVYNEFFEGQRSGWWQGSKLSVL